MQQHEWSECIVLGKVTTGWPLATAERRPATAGKNKTRSIRCRRAGRLVQSCHCHQAALEIKRLERLRLECLCLNDCRDPCHACLAACYTHVRKAYQISMLQKTISSAGRLKAERKLSGLFISLQEQWHVQHGWMAIQGAEEKQGTWGHGAPKLSSKQHCASMPC